MKRLKGASKRLLSGFLALIMIAMLIPMVSAIDAEAVAEKVTDPATFNSWQKWFGSSVYSTENAGGVWTDKSVFSDASAFPEGTISLDDDNNFLVALSSIAANKTIVGYSNIPTDTMLVLDVSGSMEGNVDDLVDATNNAMKQLYEVNNYNRVGVVLYSGNSQFGASDTDTATVLLPLDRYTANNASGNFLAYSSRIEGTGNDRKVIETVSVAANVYGTKKSGAMRGSKDAVGGTYIQNGLYLAYQQFANVENTVIESGFQAGMQIMPIIVLMSDGAPTSATTSYTNVGRSNVGTGGESSANAGMAFVTQLTASYVHGKVKEKYNREPLFYTLGLGVSDSKVATSVLDPVGETETLWQSYNKLGASSALSVTLPSTTGSTNPSFSGRSVYRNSYCTLSDYVDEYYPAENSREMIESFNEIVNQIIIQSRYYPTNLQGNDPDFGGYITFEDRIGEYMEVKDIKGILLGKTLFDGAMLASQINSSSNGLGTVDNPTDLGNEFIRAIRTRLGITNVAEAQLLAAQAWEYKQLYYENEDNYSNYIGWYAKADGSYHSFWHEGMTQHPEDAVYINRSYGFLGKAEGNIKDSDMMYMSVQVHTNIRSGHQAVIWKIPAALVPMVTYSVTLKGDSVENATDIKLEVQNAEPIRLVFEVGLRSEINELNVSTVMAAADSKFKTADGYYFWTNHWNSSGTTHENDTATEVTFHPSTENERYYFVEDTDIYISDGNGGYEKVKYNDEGGFDANTKYYRARVVFTQVNVETRAAEKSTVYEELTASALAEKQRRNDGSWYIPRGTISHFFDDYFNVKADNPTESLEYSSDPFVKITSASYDSFVLHGNNGRLKVTPAQGIRLAKTLDITEPDTDTEFKFVIELDAPAGVALADEYPYVIANIGEYSGEEGFARVDGSKIEITISAGQAIFITDIPTGTEYTVTESDENPDYKLKTVSVNGVYSANRIANGSITEYKLDDVEFVNTPIINGSLIIDKTVTHPFGEGYSIPSDLEFDITVSLDGRNIENTELEAVREGGVERLTVDENKQVSFKLKHGEAVSIHGIPEGTVYTVSEKNIPEGFTLITEENMLTGSISADKNASVSLVNNYVPAPVSPKLQIEVSKLLSGREFKEGDSFEFLLQRYSEIGSGADVTVDRVRVAAMEDVENGVLKAVLGTAQERYTEAGVYRYYITETDDSALGNGIAGVTYDASRLHFSVTVSDSDMDGALEISAVTATAPVTVSGNADDGYIVSGSFNNSYKANVPAGISINITKYIEDPAGSGIGRNGFSFGLYEGEELVATSNLTDTNGKAVITMTYSADQIGESYIYTLKELAHVPPIPGMTYSTEERTITVEIVDNGDGTVGALINGKAANGYATGFTNTYDPTDAVLIISGTKELTGRVVNENEFSFRLYETGADFAIDGVVPTYTAFAGYDRSFVFPTFTYNTVGKYYYVITEAAGKLGGITYDDTVYTVEVEVTESNGVLTANAVISADGEKTDSIVFRNEYKVTPINVEIKGTKQLSGRDLEAGEFSFVLNGDGLDSAQTASNTENGSFAFERLEFVSAGVYSYTVAEQSGNLGGITYDNSVFNVIITVTDNGSGELEHSVVYLKNNHAVSEIVFVNTYTAAPVEIELDGKKTLSGRELKEGEFEFRLTNTGNGNIVETVRNKADGSFEFKPITYYVADNYHYTVAELNNGLGGVDYDVTVYSVHVKVTDNGSGALVADVEYIKNGEETECIEFANEYHAAKTAVTLVGTKTLTGRELKAGEFEFLLVDAEGNEKKASNGADGSIRFDEISYDKAGVYSYTVTETDNGLGGVDYDETVYTVIVTVTDNLVGQLVAEIEIDGGNAIAFTNGYSAESAKAVIRGEKLLNGRDINENEFAFEIKDEQTGETVTVYNDADGGFESEEIIFASVGTYVYTVTEKNNGLGGIVYDQSVYTATVRVSDNLAGQLVAEVEYTQNGEAVEKIVFENGYKADGYEFTVSGVKELIGRDMSENEFSFTLYDVNNQKDIESVYANANGAIEFAPVILNEIGRHTFKITENSGELMGVTYDESVYTVIVTVADDGEGRLYAESVEYIKNDQKADEIRFVNEYKPEKASVVFGGEKTLSGRELKEGEFEFELYETDESYAIEGVTPMKAGNTADGGFEFSAIEYETAGDRYYVIIEADNGVKGITYDKAVYRVHVGVTDNKSGALVAEAVITDANGSAAETVVFANVYNPLTVSVELGVNKTIDSKQEKTIGAEGFNFVLTKDGVTVLEAATDKNGKASFTLNYSEADVGKTYTYILSEVNGGLAGITYDKSEYLFEITVDYDENGDLVATVTKNQSAENAYTADFVNIYEIVEPGDNTSFISRIALLFISGGAAITLFANGKKKRRSF